MEEATPEELAHTLSFALRWNGRKRVHDADELMARITVDRLMKHLADSGYVVMKKPVVHHNHSHPYPHKGDSTEPEGSSL